MPTQQDNFLEQLISFALQLPTNPAAYSRTPNPVRDLLLDLADCARAAVKLHTERRAAFNAGKPAPERTETSAGHAATTEDK